VNSAQTPNASHGRLDSAGLLDPSFAPVIDASRGNVLKTVAQPDGKVLVAGTFKEFSGFRTEGVARLKTDNTIDESFHVEVNGPVSGVAVQPDGKILIGGTFTVVNGNYKWYLARFNSDGSLDTSFDPSGGSADVVNDIAVCHLSRAALLT
jgi:uncharacterized delta-60 repeat protein